jgi:hypothetical protein
MKWAGTDQIHVTADPAHVFTDLLKAAVDLLEHRCLGVFESAQTLDQVNPVFSSGSGCRMAGLT